MPSINGQLFANSSTVRVRDVSLSAADDVQAQREKLARIVLDELREFVGLLDTNGTTLEFNRAALEAAGIRLEDIQGEPFWETRFWAVSAETRELQRRLIEQARNGESVRREIEIYARGTGEEKMLIDYSLGPVRDCQGRIVFLLAEGRRINWKRRAGEEFERKSREVNRLMEEIAELVLRPAAAILASASNLTDTQRDEVAGLRRNADRLVEHANTLLDVMKTAAIAEPAESARLDPAIERKHAGEERKKLAALIENSNDFIGMASPDGRVIFINPAGRRLVGLGRDEDISHTTLTDYLADQELGRLDSEILPRVWRDNRWEGETLFRNFDTGALVPVWAHAFLIRDGGSERPIALATVSRDLSERKSAEQRIAAASCQVAHMARVTAMGELVAAIAHEVNQPLAAVVTNANACVRWLTSELPDLAEAREAAERIAGEGRRASEVLGRIRTLMRKGATQMEPIDLRDTIRQVLTLVGAQAGQAGISLRMELSEVPEVSGDAVQLQQVLLNLIMNGIEATVARAGGARDVVISSQRLQPNQAYVAVRDSGVGLDPARLDQLFTPFYTTKETGLGMGLSISRTIIEAHGGRLWATQNEDRGATFQFSIPAWQAVEP